MATFEDLLLQHSEQSDIHDNETKAKILSDLYSNPTFVDLLMLFKQTGELDVMRFKQVLINLKRHIDCFVEPTAILTLLIIELSDANDNLLEYADDIRGVVVAIRFMES
jgi:hypothetical protein